MIDDVDEMTSFSSIRVIVRASPNFRSIRPFCAMWRSSSMLRLRFLFSFSPQLIPTRLLTSTPTPTTHIPEAPLSPLARTLHDLQNPPTPLFLLGGPGSGKGTLSSFIVSRLRHHHVSVGALLRHESKRLTPEAREILTAIQAGGFVPAATSTKLLLSHLADISGPCVVDGFPRTLDNARTWESLGLRPRKVVALEVDEQTMRKRLMARGREDDVPKVAERRLSEFWVEWEMIKQFYMTRGLLTVIDGRGSPEEVWERFEKQCMDLKT